MPHADNAAHAELRIASEDFTGDAIQLSRQSFWQLFSGRGWGANLFERLVAGMGGAVLESQQTDRRASKSCRTSSTRRNGQHDSVSASGDQSRRSLFTGVGQSAGDFRAASCASAAAVRAH